MMWRKIAVAAGWLFSLLLGFLLLGALRRLDRLFWQLEQMRATAPRRLGRDGLAVGRKAPDFTLPSASGGTTSNGAASGNELSLRDLLGKRVLLVFTQEGCSPCRDLAPVLKKTHGNELHVVNVYNGKMESARAWAESEAIPFPVAVQENLAVSKRYEAYATPFAFVVNERGIVAARGVVNNSQHVEFLLSDARAWESRAAKNAESEPAEPSAEANARQEMESDETVAGVGQPLDR